MSMLCFAFGPPPARENVRDYRDEAMIRRGRQNAQRQLESGLDPQVALIEDIGADAPWVRDNLIPRVNELQAMLKAAGNRWHFPCLVDRQGNRVTARIVTARTKWGLKTRWMVCDEEDKAIDWIPLPPAEPISPEDTEEFWTDHDKARDPRSYEIVLRDVDRRHRNWQHGMERWEKRYGVRLSTELAPARVRITRPVGTSAASPRVEIVQVDGPY